MERVTISLLFMGELDFLGGGGTTCIGMIQFAHRSTPKFVRTLLNFL